MTKEEAVGIGLLAGLGGFRFWVYRAGRASGSGMVPLDVDPVRAAAYKGPTWRCQPLPGVGGLGRIKLCRQRDLDPMHPEKKVCLYARSTGRLLGRHKDRPSALRQEAAIHVRRGR